MPHESNSITDFADTELIERLRIGTRDVYWSPNDCLAELDRRARNRQASALNLWTAVISIATLINAAAAVMQVFFR